MTVLRDLSGKMTSERVRIRQLVPNFAIGHAAEYPSVPGAERGRLIARATTPFCWQAPTALRAEIGLLSTAWVSSIRLTHLTCI